MAETLVNRAILKASAEMALDPVRVCAVRKWIPANASLLKVPHIAEVPIAITVSL
jgi:hypothetical protein